ncbi:MAG: methionine synthase [Mycobacterium sp.]|jgi:methionine synthase II (cobalamin-independent)
MSVFATATGIGSWPGTTAREAAEIIVGELHSLPHLPELPARGVGADMIGRTGALLVDIGFDTVARAYRIAPGRSAVMRRAVSWLNEDLDALEEAWEKAGLRGSGRTVKVQAAGPITLAAQLELANGHRAITDAGALRDLAGSLSEGLAAHRAEVARRLGTEVVVQLDEPLLPAAMLGRLTGVTRFSPVNPVEEQVAALLLDECIAAVGGEIALHSCAADLPWKLLQRSQLRALAVDVSTLQAADLDGVGEFVESGRTVLLGVVPGSAPQQRWEPKNVAAAAASVTDRLGFPRTVLRERIGITPACGLAGATEQWARTAIGLAQKAADGVQTDPEGI